MVDSRLEAGGPTPARCLPARPPAAGTVAVITNDGRNIVGLLRGYDQATNLILDECHERVYSTKEAAAGGRILRCPCRLHLWPTPLPDSHASLPAPSCRCRTEWNS